MPTVIAKGYRTVPKLPEGLKKYTAFMDIGDTLSG
jgi:hypothetical protein